MIPGSDTGGLLQRPALVSSPSSPFSVPEALRKEGLSQSDYEAAKTKILNQVTQ
jgi:hypothetical protein